MFYGTLTKTDNGTFTGRIANLTFDVDVTAVPNPFKSKESHPDFHLMGKSPRGMDIRVGSIWEQISKDGVPYFSVAVNLGREDLRNLAFEGDEAGTYTFADR